MRPEGPSVPGRNGDFDPFEPSLRRVSSSSALRLTRLGSAVKGCRPWHGDT